MRRALFVLLALVATAWTALADDPTPANDWQTTIAGGNDCGTLSSGVECYFTHNLTSTVTSDAITVSAIGGAKICFDPDTTADNNGNTAGNEMYAFHAPSDGTAEGETSIRVGPLTGANCIDIAPGRAWVSVACTAGDTCLAWIRGY